VTFGMVSKNACKMFVMMKNVRAIMFNQTVELDNLINQHGNSVGRS
jgi:hypothetical protein